MICEPITCSGNDLAAVCADIRLRGGCIEAMDVIGRAKYRVSYFERIGETEVRGTPPVGQTPNALDHFNRMTEESQSAAGRSGNARHAGLAAVPVFERAAEMNPTQQERGSRAAMDPRKLKDTAAVGEDPTALIHLPKQMRSKNVAAGGETRAEKPESVLDAPASILERGDRTIESNDSTKDKQQASENHFGKVATVRGLLLSDAGSARNAMTRKPSSVCAEPAALYSSIEDRMAALQSKLIASGKIKRSKPKTMPDNDQSLRRAGKEQ